MDRQPEIRSRMAELEQRRLRLEEVKHHARTLGGPEGERLEARATEATRKLRQQTNDLLRASLEERKTRNGRDEDGRE